MEIPTVKERFDDAAKHATLLRALLAHPKMHLTTDGLPDRSKTLATLYNVADFELNTYKNFILPQLPPHAAQNSKALAIKDVDKVEENPTLLRDDQYPNMHARGLREKWIDTVGRTMMISDIILEKNRQIMFGGLFDFGKDVNDAARALKIT